MCCPLADGTHVFTQFVSSAQSLVGEEFGLTSNVSCGISLGSIICWPCRAIARDQSIVLVRPLHANMHEHFDL